MKEIEGEVIRPKPVIWFELDGRKIFGNRSVEEKWLKYRCKMGKREMLYKAAKSQWWESSYFLFYINIVNKKIEGLVVNGTFFFFFAVVVDAVSFMKLCCNLCTVGCSTNFIKC